MDATQGSGPAPGSVLGGRYELVTPLWRDGAVELYEAHDRVLKRAVAVKICHDGTPAERDRFEAEVRWLARSSGPGRVRVYDTGTHGEDQYAVVELQDVLTVPGEMTAPVVVAPTAPVVDDDLTGEITEVIGRHSDTAILPLPLLPDLTAEGEPAIPETERRRRRSLFLVGATAALAATLVLGLALANGGESPSSPVTGASASTTSSTIATVGRQSADTTLATTTTMPTTTTTVAPTTTLPFPFGGPMPHGKEKKLGAGEG